MPPYSYLLLFLTTTTTINYCIHAFGTEAVEFKDPQLPYPYNALEPYIDEATMKVHSTGHHIAYATKTKTALRGLILDVNTPSQIKSLATEALATGNVERLLREEEINGGDKKLRTMLRNNGGGLLNHNEYFAQFARPAAATTTTATNNEPPSTSRISKEIIKQFKSFQAFKEQFSSMANDLFGSGFVFLTWNKQTKSLEIVVRPNQDRPSHDTHAVILNIDVWEHAYYLKRLNKRAEYVEAFWHVIDWQYVEMKLVQYMDKIDEL
jgi:Fe-Mn family superoxide dismutase